jgi:hypothetical protein
MSLLVVSNLSLLLLESIAGLFTLVGVHRHLLGDAFKLIVDPIDLLALSRQVVQPFLNRLDVQLDPVHCDLQLGGGLARGLRLVQSWLD